MPLYDPPLVSDSPGHVFHETTYQDTADTLYADGIDATVNSRNRNPEEKIIEAVADALDRTLPVNRREVVFCYPRAEFVNELAPAPETDPEDVYGGMANEIGGVIIDVSSLNHDMYLADMGKMSRVIDYLHMDGGITIPQSPDAAVPDDRGFIAARDYIESITPVSNWAEMADACNACDWPELLIDGDVPPSAVVATYPNP